MDVGGFRLIDIAGPEQADVAVFEVALARDAFDGELYCAIFEKLIALTAFEKPVGRRLLIELDSVRIDDAQLHGEVAWFEDDRPGVSGAVVDVLEVQAGIGGDKEVDFVFFMSERGDAAVASAVAFEDFVIDGLIVYDNCFDSGALGY